MPACLSIFFLLFRFIGFSLGAIIQSSIILALFDYPFFVNADPWADERSGISRKVAN
jgi:hypothetical protein